MKQLSGLRGNKTWKKGELRIHYSLHREQLQMQRFAIFSSFFHLLPFFPLVIFQARIWKWISNFHSPDDLPNPRIELVSPVSPELQADSLSAKPLEKMKSRFA